MTTQLTILPESGYVRLPTILLQIPVSKATWWKGVKSGRFPKPTKLGERISAWKAEDIRVLLKSFDEQT